MKKKVFILIMTICFLPTISLDAQVIGIHWNTFLGSSSFEGSSAIVLDSSGNSYVTGSSNATWGSPVNAHSGSYDAFVTCMDSSGNLLWNTFLGCASYDSGFGIALDSSGNIYVTGVSEVTWGSPISDHSGGDADAFVACLDNTGNLLWNTFLGSASDDQGYGIALDSLGNIYVTGESFATWGTPVVAYSGSWDGFVAGLDSSGNLLWNTFFGSNSYELGRDIALDSSGNIYVTGRSDATWGSPINAHSGDMDVFVACMKSSGDPIWNTFLGSSTTDYGRDITFDNSGNIYITGYSASTWGSPLNANSGSDLCVACLDNSGNLIWNTFCGSTSSDFGYGIALDSSGNIYVAGRSGATWGSPVNAYSGQNDALVACMDSSGNLLWNTFLGSSGSDGGAGIVLDSSGNIYVTGNSDATWGSPINAHSGGYDAYVAKLSPPPSPDIIANGSDGPIIITQSDTLQIKVSLISYGLTDNADWWLLTHSPFGWYYYDYSTKKWKAGKNVTRQGRLLDLNPKTVLDTSGLKSGIYRFYFGVDLNMDGNVTHSSLYYDEVKVTVTSD